MSCNVFIFFTPKYFIFPRYFIDAAIDSLYAEIRELRRQLSAATPSIRQQSVRMPATPMVSSFSRAVDIETPKSVSSVGPPRNVRDILSPPLKTKTVRQSDVFGIDPFLYFNIAFVSCMFFCERITRYTLDRNPSPCLLSATSDIIIVEFYFVFRTISYRG